MLKFKKMGSDKVPLLLVTANVGSIFEDVSILLNHISSPIGTYFLISINNEHNSHYVYSYFPCHKLLNTVIDRFL